ncbi:MAG: hypothetical protein PHG80_11690 [Methanoregulaceae archaeon]|nr:hypothetical protein [Methanoregulaceae archaeon]
MVYLWFLALEVYLLEVYHLQPVRACPSSKRAERSARGERCMDGDARDGRGCPLPVVRAPRASTPGQSGPVSPVAP